MRLWWLYLANSSMFPVMLTRKLLRRTWCEVFGERMVVYRLQITDRSVVKCRRWRAAFKLQVDSDSCAYHWDCMRRLWLGNAVWQQRDWVSRCATFPLQWRVSEPLAHINASVATQYGTGQRVQTQSGKQPYVTYTSLKAGGKHPVSGLWHLYL